MSRNRIEALTHLFQSRYGFVVGVAQRYAPAPDLVDDIVQQVYMDFVEKAPEKNWDLQRDIGPLLYQIAKRKAQKLWRERRRTVNLYTDRVAEELMDVLEEKTSEDYDALHDKIQALNQCLEKLSSRNRALVEQHYFGGTSMKEIGRQQDMKESAIHQFFCRVRLKLRDCIEQTLDRIRTDDAE